MVSYQSDLTFLHPRVRSAYPGTFAGMKNTTRIAAAVLAVASLAACSKNSNSAANSDKTSTTVAVKQDQKIIDSAFSIETAIRTAAKEAAAKGTKVVNSQKAEFVSALKPVAPVEKSVVVLAAGEDGKPVVVWKNGNVVKAEKTLAAVQSQIEITGNGNAVCMRLAEDASMFITDVPAMKEQLTQFKTASGITKITLDGSAACTWAK